ncbi:unnamed protein product [Mucor fragilis]
MDSDTPVLNHPSEADLLNILWPFAYKLYKDKMTESKLGERFSAAVATAKNEDRGLDFEERIHKKIYGAKLDVLYKSGSLELESFKVGKEKVTEQDDKYLGDGMMKLPKALRDMLSIQSRTNTSHMDEPASMGYLVMAVYIYNVILV